MARVPAAILFLLPVLFLAFFPAGCAGSRTDSETALESARMKVMEEFARIDLELKRAAERLGAEGLTGYGARSALEDLFNAFPYAVDCTAVDSTGRMVTVEPAPYRHFEGNDISDQEQVKRILDRRVPVLSGVFRTVEGIEATDAEYPVFGSDGAFLGSVSLLFSAEGLLATALNSQAGEKTPATWVVETGGRILFHRDKARLGSNFFAWDRLRTEEKLRRFAEQLASRPDGADAGLGATWTSASLYDTAWRLVIFGEY